MKKAKVFLTVAFVFLFVAAGALMQKAAEGETKATGADLCKDCHPDQYEMYLKHKHSKKKIAGSPANNSDCIACHKAGVAHAEAGGGRGAGGIVPLNSKKTPAETKSAICLACHASFDSLAFWDAGAHKKNDVACTDCHSMHEQNQRPKQPETCFGCHKDVQKDANRQSHHPIIEGKIKCSDCHNPHGALSNKMIKAESNNQLCFTCHPDKRGPWIYEHPPVAENCVNCHWPHGTKASKLLKEKLPNLCTNCHAWDHAKGNTTIGGVTGFAGSSPSPRMFGRACMNCHGAIHGSNAPADPAKQSYGQRFVR